MKVRVTMVVALLGCVVFGTGAFADTSLPVAIKVDENGNSQVILNAYDPDLPFSSLLSGGIDYNMNVEPLAGAVIASGYVEILNPEDQSVSDVIQFNSNNHMYFYSAPGEGTASAADVKNTADWNALVDAATAYTAVNTEDLRIYEDASGKALYTPTNDDGNGNPEPGYDVTEKYALNYTFYSDAVPAPQSVKVVPVLLGLCGVVVARRRTNAAV